MIKINSIRKLKKWNKHPTIEKPYITEWLDDYFESLLEKNNYKKALSIYNDMVEFTEKCEKISKNESMARVDSNFKYFFPSRYKTWRLKLQLFFDYRDNYNNSDILLSFNEWFGLSCASWLTVPRIVLESMPIEWQHKFTNLLMEMNTTFDWKPDDMSFQVSAKVDNKFVRMPYLLSDYRRANIEHLRKKDGKIIK